MRVFFGRQTDRDLTITPKSYLGLKEGSGTAWMRTERSFLCDVSVFIRILPIYRLTTTSHSFLSILSTFYMHFVKRREARDVKKTCLHVCLPHIIAAYARERNQKKLDSSLKDNYRSTYD